MKKLNKRPETMKDVMTVYSCGCNYCVCSSCSNCGSNSTLNEANRITARDNMSSAIATGLSA